MLPIVSGRTARRWEEARRSLLHLGRGRIGNRIRLRGLVEMEEDCTPLAALPLFSSFFLFPSLPLLGQIALVPVSSTSIKRRERHVVRHRYPPEPGG